VLIVSGVASSASIAAEAASDFLVDLKPAQAALGLVIVEEDGEVVEEGERLILP